MKRRAPMFALVALIALPRSHAQAAPPLGPVASGASAAPVASDEPIGASCADCHAPIVASYRKSGMAHALGPLEPGEIASLSGRGAVLEEATGLRYHFEEDSGGAWIVETLERAGEPPGGGVAGDTRAPARASHALRFAIGAGRLDRSYAAERSGRLRFAPLEVLGQGGARRAALSPVHAMSPGSRLEIPITPECLACHTDRLPARDFPLDLEPPASAWTPRGIDCGACHARAAEHARFREQELSGGATGADPLVAHRGLGRVQRVSICAGCHLQGDARIELVPGRFAPPEPGGDLLEHRAVFVAREPGPEIGFVSQVERLVLSRCYRESQMSCETCHDPHRPLLGDTAAEAGAERSRVRAACGACHADPGLAHAGGASARACSVPMAERSQGKDCASCHMPRTGVFDVAEVEIHDHWIQREPPARPPRGPLRAQEAANGDVARFAWPDAAPPAHADDPGLRMMALYRFGALEPLRALVDARPGPRAERLPMYHHARGVILEALGRTEDARVAYKRALLLDPDLAESATNLGFLLGRSGRTEEGLKLLGALFERHPRADGALRNRAALKLASGDAAGFAQDLERAFELYPQAAVAAALADHHRERGRSELARTWSERAAALDPLGDAAPRER